MRRLIAVEEAHLMLEEINASAFERVVDINTKIEYM
jgi:hypothetical protein